MSIELSDIKTRVQGVDPNVQSRNVRGLASETGNIYEVLAVISKRSRQISVDIKQELHNKLDEFAVHSDTIEEVSENKEQIEISKFYERLPNPAVIALEEYIGGGIHFHYREERRDID